MYKTIRKLLVLLPILLIPAKAHAFVCVCDVPIMEALLATTNATLLLTNQNLLQINQSVNGVTGAVNELNVQNAKNVDAQGAKEAAIAQSTAAANTMMKGQGEIGSAMSWDTCGGATQKEAVGYGLYQAGQAASTTYKFAKAHLRSTGSQQDTFASLHTLDESSMTPEFVGSPAGTLSDTDFNRQVNYTLNMLAPAPPTAPEKLPQHMQGSPQGQMYKDVFNLFQGNYEFYAKIALRDSLLKKATVPAQADLLQEWKEVQGTLPPEPNSVTPPGSSVTLFPDQWATVSPQNIGGTNYISELDYMRIGVFKRYANPVWYGEKINQMVANQLQKEVLDVMALQSRMLYEIMINSQNTVTMMADQRSRENNAQYGQRLNEIYSGMAAGH